VADTENGPAKQTSAKKTSAKKTSARKTSTKKTASKDAAARTAPRRTPARKSAPERPSGRRLALAAAEQLAEMTGHSVEGVVGLERSDDGWTVGVEVLELRRIPNTTDVMAVYEVTLDGDGELDGYRRVRRYVRGEAGEDWR
jgi:hypothetical protein